MQCLEERETDLAINLSRTSSRSLLRRWCHNTRRLNGLKKGKKGREGYQYCLTILCALSLIRLFYPLYLLNLGNTGTLNSNLDRFKKKKKKQASCLALTKPSVNFMKNIRHTLTLSRNPREDISLANLFRLCSFKKKKCEIRN